MATRIALVVLLTTAAMVVGLELATRWWYPVACDPACRRQRERQWEEVSR